MDFIKNVRIKNFKSIEKIEFGTKRINLLIGKPNAGKSNILEAMTLFSSFFSPLNKYAAILRYKSVHDFTRFGQIDKLIGIELDDNCIYIKNNIASQDIIESAYSQYSLFNDLDKENNFPTPPENIRKKIMNHEIIYNSGQTNRISAGAYLNSNNKVPVISPYIFKWPFSFTNSFDKVLEAPFGGNLANAIAANKELQNIAQKLFKENNLSLVIERNTNNIEVQKSEDSLVFKIPFNNISDTLVRLLFFQAAVLTNKEKVLLFEEPEAHAFPPYMLQMTQSIIESTENQFFIATHSPYIIEELIQKADKDDVAVHVVFYKDDSTHIHTLSQDEIDDYLTNGEDILMGMSAYEISDSN